ncbi:unnamed protein product [Mytilus coruscus]|uniref:B box-type domain-containing protein n=1 Tax=Mytilus coruscus TaxID=42192 RepID=A0A6J8CMV9_MYTCO|nr:unnamed protein product [Mytilus coruscus]
MTDTSVFCRTHNNDRCRLYCQGCQELVCRVCLQEEHKGHRFITLTTAMSDKRDELETYCRLYDDNINHLVTKENELQNTLATKQQQFTEQKRRIASFKDTLIQKIDDIYSDLQQKWGAVQEETSNLTSRITHKRSEMVQIKQNMEDVLHKSDIVEMCETAHVVGLTITENLTNEHISLTASLPEYVAPEITSDLAGKLEYAHPCQQAFLYSRVDGENAGSFNSSKIKISFEIIDSIQTSLCSVTSIVYDSKDEKSSFYVVSSSENIIMKYYRDGKSRKIKDLSGKRILSLAVVSAGRILAIAEGDCNIYSLKVIDTLKISKSWKVKTFFTFSDSQIPTAVNTSKVYGNIYIATTQKTDGNRINRISVLTDKKPHEILLVAEIHLETSFVPVKAIACSRGNVTVVMKRDREDDAEGCICAVKSDPNSELQWYYGGQTGTENQERIFSPTDVTETIRGNLIACDPLNNSLHILNHKGELISFIDTVNTFGIVRPLSLDAFGRRIFVGTSSSTVSPKAKIYNIYEEQ